MARAQKLLMRSVLVRPVLALAGAAGADPMALARRFGLPESALGDTEVVLPLSTLHALVDAAADAAGDPFLGLHLAQRYPRGVFGVLEFSSRSAPTLREAFARIVRYTSLMNELVVVTLSE